MSIKGDKQHFVVFDNNKIKQINKDFSCSIDLADGIRSYFAYMDDHPELKQADPEFDQWCDNLITTGKVL